MLLLFLRSVVGVVGVVGVVVVVVFVVGVALWVSRVTLSFAR